MSRCVKCEWAEKILDFDDEGWGRASITNMDMTAKNTFSINIKVFKIYLTLNQGLAGPTLIYLAKITRPNSSFCVRKYIYSSGAHFYHI